jgi:hypothetical protein
MSLSACAISFSACAISSARAQFLSAHAQFLSAHAQFHSAHAQFLSAHAPSRPGLRLEEPGFLPHGPVALGLAAFGGRRVCGDAAACGILQGFAAGGCGSGSQAVGLFDGDSYAAVGVIGFLKGGNKALRKQKIPGAAQNCFEIAETGSGLG